MDRPDQAPTESLREKVAHGLVGALGKMAKALADKKLDQATRTMRKVRDMDISDVRRIRAEERAARFADDAIKLDRAAEQARAFTGERPAVP